MVLVKEAEELIPSGLRVHQLLCGREIANDIRGNMVHQFAYQMANYVYIVEDVEGKSAVVVDPAWDVEGIFKYCEESGLTVTKALFSHHHFDHCGGKVPRAMTNTPESIMLPGLSDFANKGIQVYVGKKDAKIVAKQSAVPLDSIVAVEEGDEIPINEAVSLTVLSTPGHTPGSTTFSLGSPGVLFTGDTLFIGSCGRVDLPDSSVNDMVSSLARLSTFDPKTLVLPGHNYAMPSHSSIGLEKDTNSMMMQAIERFQKSGGTITSEPVAALLPLPDYLGVARKVFADIEEGKGGSFNHHQCCHHSNVNASQLESHF